MRARAALPTALAVLILLVTVLAGCLAQTGPGATPAAADGSDAGPQAVVALIDTGINPYHEAFRDDSPLAYVHPSKYLPGYPEDAVALNITLGVADIEEALEEDGPVWESVEAGQLYWFPGTRIVGALAMEVDPDDDLPIFSTGHGTMTASRAASDEHSLCPTCRIVAVEGFTADNVRWAGEQPWIDAQSNSWSPFIVVQQAEGVPVAGGDEGLSDAFEDAADRHLVFGSAGNGAMGKLGVAGHPSFTRSTSGPPGVVSVGGHDNGEVALWPGSVPHVVADVCRNMAAVGDSVDEYGPVGGGTSSASPYAAGAAARLVLEARRLLDDPYDAGHGDDGVLARGTAPARLEGTDSPLADGDLTLEEVKEVLFKTAIPRPVEEADDGEVCRTRAPYNTYPVPWDAIPSDVPTYYFIGYGQVSWASLGVGLAVLDGAEPLPDRAFEDQQHAWFDQLREAYNGLPP